MQVSTYRDRAHAMLALTTLVLAGTCAAAEPQMPERVIRFDSAYRSTLADRGSWIARSAISADGTRSLFASAATNLVAEDRNGWEDVFLFDAPQNELRRVVINEPGSYKILGDPLINGDGAYAIVSALRLNRAVFPSEWERVVSRFHLSSGAVTHVELDGVAYIQDVSVSGRFVAFLSDSQTQVPGFSDGTRQAYRLDFADGSIIPISRIGGAPSPAVWDAGLSGDGSVACFTSGSTGPQSSTIWIAELGSGIVNAIPPEVLDAEPLSMPSGCRLNRDGNFVAFVNNSSKRSAFWRDRSANTTLLVSRRLDGQPASIWSGVQISDTGLRITFASTDSQLVVGDLPETSDVFMFEAGQAIRRFASTVPVHDGFSFSGNGEHVLVASGADLVASENGLNFGPRLFRVSLGSDEVLRLTQSRTGLHFAEPVEAHPSNPDLYGIAPYLSADGNRVVFVTYDGRTYPPPQRPGTIVVLRDILQDRSVVVSMGSNGEAMTGEMPAISANGRFVAFLSRSDSTGSGVANGYLQLYLRDVELNTTRLISKSLQGLPGNGAVHFAVVSGDGKAIAFTTSASNLGTGSGLRVLLWSASGDELRTVADIGHSSLLRSVSISSDGSVLAFSSSRDDLVPDDAHSGADVFLFWPATSALQRIDARADSTSYSNVEPALSGDGRFVAFDQATQFRQLVIHDVNAGTTESFGSKHVSNGLFTSISHNGSKIVLYNDGAFQDQQHVPLRNGVVLIDRISGQAVNLDGAFADHVQPYSGRLPVIAANGDIVAFLAKSGAYDRQYQHGSVVMHRVQLSERIFGHGFESDAGPNR